MGKKLCTDKKPKTITNAVTDYDDDNLANDYFHYMFINNPTHSIDSDDCFKIDYNLPNAPQKKAINSSIDYKQFVHKFKKKPACKMNNKDDLDDIYTTDYNSLLYEHNGHAKISEVELRDIDKRRNRDIIDARVSFKSPSIAIRKHFSERYFPHYQKIYSNWLFNSFKIAGKPKIYEREDITICKYSGCDTVCLSRSSFYYHISTMHGYKGTKRGS